MFGARERSFSPLRSAISRVSSSSSSSPTANYISLTRALCVRKLLSLSNLGRFDLTFVRNYFLFFRANRGATTRYVVYAEVHVYLSTLHLPRNLSRTYFDLIKVENSQIAPISDKVDAIYVRSSFMEPIW